MHIIAMHRHLLYENPWIARNLYNAFDESKRRSVERLLDPRGLALPARMAVHLRTSHVRCLRR